MNKAITINTILLLSISQPVFAYIGPGMGGGVILAIVGFFAALFLGLFGILYYPIKRALKNRKEAKTSPEDNETSDDIDETKKAHHQDDD